MCILRLEKFLIHASPYNTTREFSIQVPVVCQTFLVFIFPQNNDFYFHFIPAAKRHGQGKVWVGLVLIHQAQTIVSIVRRL